MTDAELYGQAYDGATPTSSGLGSFFSGLLSGNLTGDSVGGALGTAGNIYATQQAMEQARALGPAAAELVTKLAGQAGQAAQFKPFTLTTGGLGTTSVDASGGVSIAPTTAEQTITENLLSAAQTMSGQPQVTATDLFQQMEDIRAGSREREALALENRLLSQGRLGTQTAMFGGTPEALARAKAIEEQRAADVLTSLQQAPALTQSNLQNLTGLLGAAYAPQTQAMGLVQATAPLQQFAQTGRLAAGEAIQAGIPEITKAAVAGEQVAGDIYQQALQGLLQQATTGQDSLTNVLGDAISGGFNDLYESLFG